MDTPIYQKKDIFVSKYKTAIPRVVIPVFPGTNCEYDTAKAFEKAGAVASVVVMRNLSPLAIEESIKLLASEIANAQMIMLPGGFSGGDEPDGSGKFIATTFRSGRVKDATHDLLKNRDGLMLGICNGFQALIKLGLVPYGEIREMRDDSPTLLSLIHISFSRGGSDITGSIVSRAANADLYENWTDVSGFMMADPRIVENPRKIDVVTYLSLIHI